MKEQSTFAEVVIQYYEGIVLFGIVMVALAVWLFEYHFVSSGDELVGLIAACAMFFGTLLLGQGIRGWRDGEELRHRYIKMTSKAGAELSIRKRKKEWFR